MMMARMFVTTLVIRNRAMIRLTANALGIPALLRITAATTSPAVPPAGTIALTPCAVVPIEPELRHPIRPANALCSAITKQATELASSTAEATIHHGSAWAKRARSEPRPGISTMTNTTAMTAKATAARATAACAGTAP